MQLLLIQFGLITVQFVVFAAMNPFFFWRFFLKLLSLNDVMMAFPDCRQMQNVIKGH